MNQFEIQDPNNNQPQIEIEQSSQTEIRKQYTYSCLVFIIIMFFIIFLFYIIIDSLIKLIM